MNKYAAGATGFVVSLQITILSLAAWASYVGFKEIIWVAFGKTLPWYVNLLGILLGPINITGGIIAYIISFLHSVPLFH